MRLGNSCCLLTTGAVLAFAVHLDLEVVDVRAVGWILMLSAVLGAAAELVLRGPRTRAVPAVRAVAPRPAAAVPPRGSGDRRGSLAPWSAWETRAFTPVPRPDRES
ncbi:hypothetical protein [Kineococcus sp. SYSU DK006]|uniref:hypothetical protein n=1 Tax=Kineococcus sp. SYSU DK006 TaxID=3383127 RepID=UPI003D7DEC69